MNDINLIYHLYPLRMCYKDDGNKYPLADFVKLIDYWKELSVDFILLAPVFLSSSHGYDTIDYYQIDPRLGNNESFSQLIKSLHKAGIKVILDGVFNHVSRDFFAFQDILQNRESSKYKDWFYINFSQNNSYQDYFSYQCWEGHQELVKLNLQNHEVKCYLFDAVKYWITEFGIDGLRLDVAYTLDEIFIRELNTICKNINPDFWLLGEMIHGNYNKLIEHNGVDSVTNYETYKGLYSSHNDHNYFEIAHTLKRCFAKNGIYENLSLYNFVDNHDVDRVCSKVIIEEHLFLLYLLLFCIPGIPSIYYGSESKICGRKEPSSDNELRPFLTPQQIINLSKENELAQFIKELASIRKNNSILKHGSYQEVYVSSEQYIFLRVLHDQKVIIAVNMSAVSKSVCINSLNLNGVYMDLINPLAQVEIPHGTLNLAAYSGMILV